MTRNRSDITGAWRGIPVRKRCRILGTVAQRIASDCDSLVSLCAGDQRTDPVETISAELMPLCSALKFLDRRGAKLLQPRRVGRLGRPLWMWGVTSEVRREPLGRVLVLGTWNYPLLLPGVQVAQALAAGNSVLLKPAAGTEAVTSILVDHFHDAGVPQEHLRLLESSTEAAVDAMDTGVDLIVLTGSASTGRKVLAKAAETLTPAIMELSGCDAVVVLEHADVERVAAAVEFGLNFNSGATCVGPRRLLVNHSNRRAVMDAVVTRLEKSPPVVVHPAARSPVAEIVSRAMHDGAVDLIGAFDADRVRKGGQMRPVVLDQVEPKSEIANADIFAPVISVIEANDIAHSIHIVNECRYRLAASVFGPEAKARIVAGRLNVGAVTINDIIAPTADPRVPFGGRGNSGFGVTRGAEGLVAMTTPTVVCVKRGNALPHLDQRQESDVVSLRGILKFLYAGSWSERLAGLRQISGRVQTTADAHGEPKGGEYGHDSIGKSDS